MAKTVLLVDDEADIREVGQISLEAVAGWEVRTVSNGRDALDAVRASRPDAILLDVMMPDMDGPTVVDRLKDDAATRDIPVVLLTAKAQAGDQQCFATLDVVAVLSKPFDPMALAGDMAAALGWAS